MERFEDCVDIYDDEADYTELLHEMGVSDLVAAQVLSEHQENLREALTLIANSSINKERGGVRGLAGKDKHFRLKNMVFVALISIGSVAVSLEGTKDSKDEKLKIGAPALAVSSSIYNFGQLVTTLDEAGVVVVAALGSIKRRRKEKGETSPENWAATEAEIRQEIKAIKLMMPSDLPAVLRVLSPKVITPILNGETRYKLND